MYRSWKITVMRDLPKPRVRRVAYGLNTHNLGEILKAILSGVGAGGVVNANLVDVDGNSRNLIMKYGGTDMYYYWVSNSLGSYAELLVLGQFGTGNATPERSDRNLQSPLPGFAVMGTSYSNGVVTLTGSVSYGTTVSPSEVGLFIELGDGIPGSKARYLLDRTVFSPLPAGNVFTVRYDINLG